MTPGAQDVPRDAEVYWRHYAGLSRCACLAPPDRAALMQTIRDGTRRIGGSMPAWGGQLSESGIEAVIVWFQALWPADVYDRWRQANASAEGLSATGFRFGLFQKT